MTIEEAIVFATQSHSGQTRKDGIGETFIPYVVHPIEVMRRLYNYGIGDQGILVAALCHDILEDCNVTYDFLLNVAGSRVANIVKELTFDKASGLSKEKYLDTFATSSYEALIIKVADRLCNVEDFSRSKPDYASKYFHKADSVFVALRSRSAELDDRLNLKVRLMIDLDVASVRNNIRGW